MNFQLSSNGRKPSRNPLASWMPVRPSRLVGHATRGGGASAVRGSRFGGSQLCVALVAAMMLAALLSVTPAAESQVPVTVGSPITVTLISPEGGAITEPASALSDGDAVPEISWVQHGITLSRRLGVGETVTVPLTFIGNITGDGADSATRGTDYVVRCTSVPAYVTCAGLDTETLIVKFTGPTETTSRPGQTAAVLRVIAKHDTTDERRGERAQLVLGSALGTRTVNGSPQTINVSSQDNAESFIVLDQPFFTAQDPATVYLSISPNNWNQPEGTKFTMTAHIEHNNQVIAAPQDLNIPLEIIGDTGSVMTQTELAPASEEDFKVPKSIKIARGALEGSVTLRYVDDFVDEIRKTLYLRVENALPTGYERSGLAALFRQFRIFDNDRTVVTLSRATGVTVEEGSTVDYTLSLSRQLGTRVAEGRLVVESLAVPLTFNSEDADAATLGTDFTLSCSTATGVTCAGLNTANPTVTFAGSSPTNDLRNNLVRSAESVTITLTATADDAAEPSGELVDIGIGRLNASAIADDASAVPADNAAVLRIVDPGTTDTEGTDPNPDTNTTPSNPNPRQPSSGTPSGGSSGSSTRVTPTTTTTVPSAVVFTDLDDTFVVHRDAVDALVKDGVFDRLGCATNRLCPDQTINRWRLAVIMVRRLDGTANPPGITRSLFSDVSASLWWSRYVQRLSRLEITKGCATDPLRYCPDDPLTRAQAASFIARAYELTSSTDPGFVDIEGSVHEADINAMYAAGITKGCATEPLRFCPDKPLTLQEFATMLHRAKQ